MIKRNRKAVIATAIAVAVVAVGAGVYLDWRLAPKVWVEVVQDGERVNKFVYRRESDNLEPCRRDLRRVLDGFEGKDFSIEIVLACPGGKIMVVFTHTYRVEYSAGTATITGLPMGDGEEVVLFTQAVSNRDELLEVLPDQLTHLFDAFRDETRSWLHEAEEAMPGR